MVEDETALGVLRPDLEPKATEHVAGIIDLIKILEEKQFAYAATNGDVYYRVKQFADYGKLTNKNSMSWSWVNALPWKKPKKIRAILCCGRRPSPVR